MSRVDVAIIAYNHGRFLNDCVRSIVSQPVGLRVLIVDDCSSDNTATVAAALVAQDSRVEYRRHANNIGAMATFNECLDWATADYTHLIAADDQLTPGALARNVALLDAHPTMGFVYGRMIVDGGVDPFPTIGKPRGAAGWSVMTGTEFIELTCKGGKNLVPALTVTVRSVLQKKIGGFNKNLPFTHDMEMWLRFAANGDVGRIDADQAVYRIHGNNLHLKFDDFVSVLEYKKTFDMFIHDHGQGLADSEKLLGFVNRALAKQALFAAHSAFEKGDNILTGHILATAKALWGNQISPWVYRRLLIKHRVGPSSWRLIKRFRNFLPV
jgi:glycosyltransferase involved in cell wall biosynthesis